jgi:hypothetical protein
MLAGERKDVVCSACCLNTPTPTPTPRQSSGGDRAVLRYYFPQEMIDQHFWFACAQMFETTIFQSSTAASLPSVPFSAVRSLEGRWMKLSSVSLQQVIRLGFYFISLLL